jgi:hypothetical protein
MKQLLEALDLALEALEEPGLLWRSKKAITAIKQARSAPVQEPVAWTVSGKITDWSKDFSAYQTKHYTRPVYTPPAAPVQSAEREEPVAWIFKPNRELLWPNEVERKNPLELNEYAPLYTTPPAAPVQEPVAWMGTDIEGNPNKFRLNPFNGGVELYKKPQSVKVWDAEGYDALMQELELWKAAAQRQWVGLNWEDVPDIRAGDHAFLSGAQWAEAKLKEKNT